MQYHYLVVGSGLFGATFARKALEAGKRVLIIDKRSHIAGNCYTEERHGIQVHKYGPHQFHTKSKRVWDFVNQFAEFNHYRSHILCNFESNLYWMPPNMMLFHQLWGVNSPEEARRHIEETRIPCERPRNVRDFILDAVGVEIYEKFYEGYSTKQWGRDPSQIPLFVAKRLPIRYTYSNRWFDDPYEGIPVGGYTKMIANMIDGADVELGLNFFEYQTELMKMAGKTIYTGKIDELFDYRFGDLEYRSLRFEEEVLDGDFQGNAIINYTSKDVPYTRIVEHKHFEFQKCEKTIITREYPQACGREDVPYYPVEDEGSRELLGRYQELARKTNIIVGGRLGEFRYFDMDQVIASALVVASKELGNNA